jgi:ubiquinone/menaquinone biosynthesis C-methylase UbiE
MGKTAKKLSGTVLSGIILLAPVITVAQDAAPTFEVETANIANALQLVAGMTVADVGAGDGRYSAFLSEKVGDAGKVYATEIEQAKVDEIRKTTAGRSNVTAILGKPESTELPEQCCDRILLRRVFHHIQYPEPMLKSILASLKPGGIIAIIDFLPRHDLENQDATPGDHEHGSTVEKLIERVKASGFELVREVEGWPSRMVDGKATDYCVLFRRPG